ncbi:MAG: UDP-N-acetylmuramoyl-L-alanine--D-glutamate ligase [candidate division WOR-3 bacterium]
MREKRLEKEEGRRRLPVLSLRSFLEGKKILILGLARAGQAAARALLKAGGKVYGFDESDTVWSSPSVRRLMEKGLNQVKNYQRLKIDWVITSPGFSDDHPVIQFFKKKGNEVVDELDFASRFLPGNLIAVTGTNGKSTTVALIATILKSAGKKVFEGGNLSPGKPLSYALLLPPQDYYVVEVSSFQLERARWLNPKVAVILNLTPDHLNRHHTMKDYIDSKARLLDLQGPEGWAVLNYDDDEVRALNTRGSAQKVYFSTKKEVMGGYLKRGWIYFRDLLGREKVARVTDLKLFGTHNLENALAAIAVARLIGIEVSKVGKGLKSFTGLEHRLEPIRRFRGVYYLNNSMCTNPRAGVRSLEAVRNSLIKGRQKIILITGGKEKGLETREYLEAINRWAAWVILMGENRYRLAQALSQLGYESFEVIPTEYGRRRTENGRKRVMELAVEAARKRAKRGDVVLFSPAFASFDMWTDFQERGKVFKDVVNRLG